MFVTFVVVITVIPITHKTVFQLVDKMVLLVFFDAIKANIARAPWIMQIMQNFKVSA